jgi:demethylmenaquinone methyltransferase / 2-methoxy-6-polyprenyl-1,4-benzoquinol methylase
MAPLWLKEWPKDRTKRAAYVDAVFRRVAPQYDRLTRLLSWGQDGRWKEAVTALLPPERAGERVLDLATGTGAFPAILRRAGRKGTIIGIDRSAAMLSRAREKCAGMDRVFLARGDLNDLPVAEGAFDVILLGYGLRYIGDLGGAVAELHGALRPGGVFISLDFGLPSEAWYRRLCLAYLFVFGTLWGLILHGKVDTYWHIVESLRAYPGQGALGRALEDAGFARIVIAEQLGGISVLARAEKRGPGAESGKP